MSSDKFALVFPGQGQHCREMLDAHRGTRYFDELNQIVSQTLGYSLDELLENDPAAVNSNLVSNMLTSLASALALNRFADENKNSPSFMAGYSNGQLMALHAAGCFDFAELTQLVMARAKFIDECVSRTPGTMLAIIGLAEQPVENICSRLRSEGHLIWISNYNCIGQYSLSGTKDAIEAAKPLLTEEKPRKMLELPVSGAWHSPLIAGCQTAIAELLRERQWREPRLPVVDNVTGEFLPEDPSLIKVQLVKHLTHPVRWEAGLKMLIKHGCTRFVEVGYGNTLTKFGFFIDRSVEHEAFYGEGRAVCAE